MAGSGILGAGQLDVYNCGEAAEQRHKGACEMRVVGAAVHPFRGSFQDKVVPADAVHCCNASCQRKHPLQLCQQPGGSAGKEPWR